MRDDKFLLALDAIVKGFNEESQEFVLLGHVEACEHRNIVLSLRAEQCAFSGQVHKFSICTQEVRRSDDTFFIQRSNDNVSLTESPSDSCPLEASSHSLEPS